MRTTRTNETTNRIISVDMLISAFFIVYLMSISIKLVNDNANVIIQNLTYLGLIGLILVKNKFKVKLYYFEKNYFFFLLFSLSSVLWTISIPNTISILRITIKIFVVCIFLSNYYMNSTDRINKFLKLLLISIILIGIYLFAYTIVFENIYDLHRLGKSIGLDTVRFTVRASLGASICWYFYQNEKKRIYILLMFLLVGFSLMTGKRTGIIFILLFISLYSLISERNISKRLKNFIKLVIMVLFTIFAVFEIDVFYNTIGVRIIDAFSTLKGYNATDASVIQRQQLMMNAYILFQKSPLIGSGMNSLRAYLALKDFEHITYAHNNYLEILSGLGIIGCYLYYRIFAKSILFFVKNKDKVNLLMNLSLVLIMCYLICDYIQVTYESYFELLVFSMVNNIMYYQKKARH